MFSSKRIDTTIPVVDMKRARRFYHETLGLEELTMPNLDPSAAADNVMFQVGDCTHFLLYRRPERTKAEHTVAAFSVDNLDQTVDELTRRGVRFEQYDMPGIKTNKRGIAESDGMRSAWFKDTEGNILGVGEF